VEKLGQRETARRLRATIGRVFRLAVATLRAPADPTYSLKGALAAPVVVHRPAITDERELAALMLSINEYTGGPTVRAAMKFLALTMARPIEVRLMRRPEVIWPSSMWRIRAERMKMRRAHDVPLSRQGARRPARCMGRFGRPGACLPLHPLGAKTLSENAMNSALRRMGYQSEEMCSHGFPIFGELNPQRARI